MTSPTSTLTISGTRSFKTLGIPSPRLLSPRPAKSSTPSPTSSHARRTPSGRYASIFRDENELGAEEVSSECIDQSYTVHIPPTPDHQAMSETPAVAMNPSIAVKAEQQFVTSTIFTGGFNSVTRGHVLEKMMETEGSHPQMACARGQTCAMEGCDGRVMRDERGGDLTPCDCSYKICRDCYVEALDGGGICPGCKESYKVVDPDTLSIDEDHLPLPPPAAESKIERRLSVGESKVERRLSLLKSMKSAKPALLMSNNMSEFDHARWLYETKGTYGYGNAVWPKDGTYLGDGGARPIFDERPRRPLSRKTTVSAGILSPYRLLVLVRLAALGLFLAWRIRHPNKDAMWLWGMSVVCELWFGFSWVLDQLPKLCPVNRTTDLNALRDKFETPSPENPRGRSDLPGIDVFVSTADPDKEPPLVTANTILSILAVDYPVDKLACYLSDDGGALLIFESLTEAASFRRVWVPFCRKHNIEPRNPKIYFQWKGDPTKNKVKVDFVKDRHRMKREYDKFKV